VENNLLQLTVSDEGQGFDPATIAAVGEPEGGFGLFGIREQVESFGGQMEIDSAPGRGSTFMLRMPIVEAEAQEAPDRTPEPVSNDYTVPELPGSGQLIRIMLADDHIVMRQGLGQLLSQESDFLIAGEAADGQQAVELAGQLLPDVILMDISMPKMNGIEATRAIHNEHPGIRILGLSMFEDPERAQSMRDAGAVGYVIKSGPPSELGAAIRASVHKMSSPRPAEATKDEMKAREQSSGSQT
jgi:CheY-like chemotaxis protein